MTQPNARAIAVAMARWMWVFLGCTLLYACSRYVPNRPLLAACSTAAVGYEATLSVLRERGYPIEEDDPQRGYIRVLALLDQGNYGRSAWVPGQRVSMTSWLMFQAFDGAVQITAQGYHLADDGQSVHKKLHEEMQGLRIAIEQKAAFLGSQASVTVGASATVSPASAAASAAPNQSAAPEPSPSPAPLPAEGISPSE